MALQQYIRVSRPAGDGIEYVRLVYIGPKVRYVMRDRERLPAPDAENVRFLEKPVPPGGYEVRYYATATGPCVETASIYLEGGEFTITGKADRTL